MTLDTTSNQILRKSSRARKIIIDGINVIDDSVVEDPSRPSCSWDISRKPLARNQTLGRSGIITLYKNLGVNTAFELDDRINSSLARGAKVEIQVKGSDGNYIVFFRGYILQSHYDGDFKTDIKIADELDLRDFPLPTQVLGMLSIKGPRTISSTSNSYVDSIVALYNTDGPVSNCPIPTISFDGSVTIPSNACTYGVSYRPNTVGGLDQSRRNIVFNALIQAGIPSDKIYIDPVDTSSQACVQASQYSNNPLTITAPSGMIITSIKPVSTNPGVDIYGTVRPDCTTYSAGGTSVTINSPGCVYNICFGASTGTANALSDTLPYSVIKNASDSLVGAAQKLLTPALNWLWVDRLGIVRLYALPTSYAPYIARSNNQIAAPKRNPDGELIPSIVRSYGTTIQRLYYQLTVGGDVIPTGENPVNYYGQASLPALYTRYNQEKINEFTTEYATNPAQHAAVATFEMNRILATKNGRPYVDEVSDSLLTIYPFAVIQLDGGLYFMDAPTWSMVGEEFSFTCQLLFIQNGSIPSTSGTVTSGGLGAGGGTGSPTRSESPKVATPKAPSPPSTPPSSNPDATIPDGPINSYCANTAVTATPVGGGSAQTIAQGSTFTTQTVQNGTKTAVNGAAANSWNFTGNYTAGACSTPGGGGGSGGNCIAVDPYSNWSVPSGQQVKSATPVSGTGTGTSSCPTISAGTLAGGTNNSACSYIICFEPHNSGYNGFYFTYQLASTGAYGGSSFKEVTGCPTGASVFLVPAGYYGHNNPIRNSVFFSTTGGPTPVTNGFLADIDVADNATPQITGYVSC